MLHFGRELCTSVAELETRITMALFLNEFSSNICENIIENLQFKPFYRIPSSYILVVKLPSGLFTLILIKNISAVGTIFAIPISPLAVGVKMTLPKLGILIFSVILRRIPGRPVSNLESAFSKNLQLIEIHSNWLIIICNEQFETN